uniref:C2H2-type domain-containing protein n=1 Tax=Parastrongyloides trichosuri TaxID=131310 RepID=A0A0N4ZZ47_PARTI
MNTSMKLESLIQNNSNDSTSILSTLFNSIQSGNFINENNINFQSISTSINNIKKEMDSEEKSTNNVDYNKIWSKAISQYPEMKLKGFSLQESYLDTGINGITLINLSCTECGVVKTTSEDLEIHIKTEHLNWYPFQCPLCDICRASDNQMREHLYSNHKRKSDEIKLFYIDNSEAKRLLQLMIDKSFYRLIENNNSDKMPVLEKVNIESGESNKKMYQNNYESMVELNSNKVKYMENFFNKFNEKNNDIDNNISLDTNGSNQNFQNLLDQFLKNSSYNNNSVGKQLEQSPPTNFTNSYLLNNIFSNQQLTILNNNEGKDEETIKRQKMLKKRVLGLCKRCKKPVTAGSRQIHIFYHMAKEYSQYRFRCKYDGCTIAHYRKDQLESHHLKVHGKIDVNMIEDRSSELLNACQELSMQLLGTSNNNPGPSATEAQIIYDKQQQEAAKRVPKRKRKLMGYQDLSDNYPLEGDSSNTSQDMLECNLCKKKILSRIKGFHVLWHLGKEKGIPRYACKLCDFKHDRAINVHRHTLMIHETSNACEDMIVKHSDDMRAMSEACFGILGITLNNNDRMNDGDQSMTTFSDLSGERLLELLKKENINECSNNENTSDECIKNNEDTQGDDDSEENISLSPSSSD